MSVSQALATPVDEIMESSALVPRTWVSSGAAMPRMPKRSGAQKVNDMLACGASYAMIVRALAADNAELDKCDRVTIDSVRTHTTKHFPVQSRPSHLPGDPRTAGKREPTRLRRGRRHRDHADCVLRGHDEQASAPLSTRTEVDVKTGLAAEKLQSLLDGRERGPTSSTEGPVGPDLRRGRPVVPQSMWAAIIEKLEELEQHPEALDVGGLLR